MTSRDTLTTLFPSDLDQQLAADAHAITQLRSLLSRSDDITMRVGLMLDSFDDRLARLEEIILPIHNTTKTLTTVSASM